MSCLLYNIVSIPGTGTVHLGEKQRNWIRCNILLNWTRILPKLKKQTIEQLLNLKTVEKTLKNKAVKTQKYYPERL